MKKEKTVIERIVAERKSVIQKKRIELIKPQMSDMEMALNHALINCFNPSPEALFWTIHYLKKLTTTPSAALNREK